MKHYEIPELEVLLLDTADVICTSFTVDQDQDELPGVAG